MIPANRTGLSTPSSPDWQSLTLSMPSAASNESVAVEDYLEKIHELIEEKGYARVADIAESFGIAPPSVSNMVRRLDENPEAVEDDLRAHEQRGDFGDDFVRLARSVYVLNDERAAVKREINDHLGAAIVEEKSYGPAA